jgi:ribosomal protein S18 acetylase RimI-like enzyme
MSADRAAWDGLWRGYLAFYETTLPAAQYDLQFARLLSDDPRAFRGLMAFRDGVAVGLAHYLFHPHGWQAQDTCYLQDLWCEPAARGTGVGRALIAAVGRAAAEAGAGPVYWLTHQDNATARALYDRVARATGFIEYELAAGGSVA